MTDKTTRGIDETIRRIEQFGVIAILRGDFSMDRILRIAENAGCQRHIDPGNHDEQHRRTARDQASSS